MPEQSLRLGHHVEPTLSIDEVIARYTQTVYGVALTHTARRADADDVFQEVFVAYWRSKPQLVSEEHRKAWLIRTTLNCCLKITQSSWHTRTVYSDVQQGENAGEEESGLSAALVSLEHSPVELPAQDLSFANYRHDALYAAIASLSSAYRTVVHLFYFEDMSIAQIASTLDEESGTIKTRLSRARAHLRERLA